MKKSLFFSLPIHLSHSVLTSNIKFIFRTSLFPNSFFFFLLKTPPAPPRESLPPYFSLRLKPHLPILSHPRKKKKITLPWGLVHPIVRLFICLFSHPFLFFLLLLSRFMQIANRKSQNPSIIKHTANQLLQLQVSISSFHSIAIRPDSSRLDPSRICCGAGGPAEL